MQMESQPTIEERFKATIQMDSQEQPQEPEGEQTTVETVEDSDVLDLNTGTNESEEVELDQADDELEEVEEDESEEQALESDIELDATYILDGVELTGQELKDGYLRQSDYTRKTQELSEQRKAVDSGIEQAKQNMELGVTALGMLTSEVDAQLQRYSQVNWQELATQADPQEYNRMQAEMQGLQQRKQQLNQQVQQFFQVHNQQQEAMKAEKAKQAVETLQANIPNWNNNTYSELQRFGVEVGFSEQEMMNATDARLFMLLHKAKQADTAKAVATKKKVKASPKRAMKSGSLKENSGSEQAKQAHARLKQTGRVDDAALAFKARMSKR